MKWLLRIVVGLVVLVAAVAAAGYFLPVQHVASRSAEFKAPPEQVFALVSDLQHYGSWWPEGTETRGFRNVLMRFPEKRLTVVLLTNRNDPAPYATALKVADLFF